MNNILIGAGILMALIWLVWGGVTLGDWESGKLEFRWWHVIAVIPHVLIALGIVAAICYGIGWLLTGNAGWA